MERRFARDEQLKQLYTDFMQEYEVLGHMSPVRPASAAGPADCFLPHHGVMRKGSPCKIRVVFNGSSAVSSGASLNRHLKVGPNLLPALEDILLRWRVHRFVLASDIEKMYRQILVDPEDRSLQRILWRHDDQTTPRTYELNTVTYGLACAPFLAVRSLRQLADDQEARFPHGSAVLRRDVYVDDILTGAPTIEEAMDLQCQLIGLCTAAGFRSGSGRPTTPVCWRALRQSTGLSATCCLGRRRRAMLLLASTGTRTGIAFLSRPDSSRWQPTRNGPSSR
ncbi:hypothetical protein ACFW04_011618 [Cataglyphis niger]